MRPIIVLGMDNTGKTTLINRLTERLKECTGLEVEQRLSFGPVKGRKKDYIGWFLQEVHYTEAKPDTIVIYDRFTPFDDAVYAPIIRGDYSLNDLHLTMRKALLHYNPLVIYARTEEELILGFSDGREQMEGVEDNAEKLLRAYDNFFFNEIQDFDNLLYNYTMHGSKIDQLAQLYQMIMTDTTVGGKIDAKS